MDKIILYLENNSGFRQPMANLLERYGYQVLQAPSIDEAYEFLRYRFVHMLLVDIRMEDDEDQDDVSGLTFALDEGLLHLPKIVLTSYRNFHHATELMRPRADGRAPVIDFLTKDLGPQVLVDKIGEAFGQHVPVNWSLRIRYAPGLTKEALASLINLARGDDFVRETELELDSLLRRTFRDYDQLSINRVLATRPGHIWLDVTAFGEQTIHHLVMSVGLAKLITAEYEAYEVNASGGQAHGGFVVRAPERMWQLAAFTLRPVGVQPESLMRLDEYYVRHSPDNVAATLENLYAGTLQGWHAQGHGVAQGGELFTVLFHELGMEVGETAKGQPPQSAKDSAFSGMCRAMERVTDAAVRADSVDVDVLDDRIEIQPAGAPRVVLPNPKTLFPRINWSAKSLSGKVHGVLAQDLVFVGSEQTAWVLGFKADAVGLLLRDFVALETDLICRLPEDVALSARLAMAARIYAASALDESLVQDADEPAVVKAMTAIQSIRGKAQAICNGDIRTYYVGVWLHCLRELDRFDPDRRYSLRQLAPTLQALFNLCYVSERLASSDQQTTFVFDRENRVVYVRGRRVNLTRQEFQIMEYLYQNRNRVCSRQEIVEEGLHEKYEGDRGDDSRLNSAIKRLRDKVEEDTSKPVYIEAVPGHGYRLNVPEPQDSLLK